MKTVYIALGSNLGAPAANLLKARECLEKEGLHIRRASSLYETAPRGFADQPWFLNQVLEAETDLLPRQLMQRLLGIEREMGRLRTVPNGPRVIDLDVLLYADAIIKTEDLQIPHPRMAERRFVLDPLAEIAPDLRHPITGLTIKEMQAAVQDQQVRRVQT